MRINSTRLAQYVFVVFSSALLLMCLLFLPAPSARAANITISSPANGQTFTGNDFTISGIADTDATIAIINNGRTIASTKSDNAGNWSVNLTGLPDGDNTITARSIKNTGFGYFISPGNGNASINQFRFSDNALNPNSPYPITDDNLQYVAIPSPVSEVMYITGGNPVPAKFDAANPAAPVPVTGNYPLDQDSSRNVSAFSDDGTKLYSPNLGTPKVSVIDVATNAWVEDIDVGVSVIAAMRGTNGLIYVGTASSDALKVIDPATDTVVKTVTAPCVVDNDPVPTIMPSADPAYPYYFASCVLSKKLHKYSVANDELVASYDIEFGASTGAFNIDHTLLYLNKSAAFDNSPDSSKIEVIEPSTGQHVKTLTTTHGVLAFFQSPDFRHIYAATPGPGFDQTGYDIIDTYNDEIEHITTSSPVFAITANTTAATLSNVNVAVVLGVKSAAATTAGTLAKTGVFVALATPVGLFLVAATLYTYLDYRKHKTPLTEASSDVNYSYFHHLKVVSLPLAKYRLSIGVDRQVGDRSDRVRRF